MWAKTKLNFTVDDLQKNTSHFLMIPRCVLLPSLQLERCTESLGFRFSVSLDFCFERCKKKKERCAASTCSDVCRCFNLKGWLESSFKEQLP